MAIGTNDGIFQFGLRESENDGSLSLWTFLAPNHRTVAAISLAHGQSVGLFSDGTIFGLAAINLRVKIGLSMMFHGSCYQV